MNEIKSRELQQIVAQRDRLVALAASAKQQSKTNLFEKAQVLYENLKNGKIVKDEEIDSLEEELTKPNE